MLYTKLAGRCDGTTINRKMWHKIIYNACRHLNIGYSCLQLIDCSDSRFEIERSRTTAIQQFIETIEGYKYFKNRSGGGSVYLYCSQYTHHKNGDIRTDLERYSETKRLENCGGMLSMSKPKRGHVRVRCTHHYHHEHSRNLSELNSRHIARIQTLTNQGLAPFQTCSIMNSERCNVT